MEMKEIDFTKCVNCRFGAKVDGKEIEGRIAVDGDYLQFFYSHGDIYSILISCYQEHGIDYFDDLEIVPRDPETYQDWQVGDHIENTNGSTGRIIFRSGDFVAADIEGTCNCYTCEELFDEEYRLYLTDIEQKIIKERKKYEPQDGDIVAWGAKDRPGDWAISIYKGNHGSYMTLFTTGSCRATDGTLDMQVIRPATDEEKQKLFDAMAKAGKRWNAEKKVVEDIPKSHEFKKGEPVLVRDSLIYNWQISVFLSSLNNEFVTQTGKEPASYKYCIPYNERTMHLLGTTEDYREGEK